MIRRLRMKIQRWRVRQRRAVRESLWMYGPWTRDEAVLLARAINYSPRKAAGLIRRARRLMEQQRQPRT